MNKSNKPILIKIKLITKDRKMAIKIIIDDRKGDYITKFTESEIAELKAKHNLDSFVLEEVKDDE